MFEHDLDMTWLHYDDIEWDLIGIKSHIYSWGRDALIYLHSASIRNKIRLVVGTSLRGRMIMVSFFDLYVYLCYDMIFGLMSYMNMKYMLLRQDDTRFEYDERNTDRGHWANSSSLFELPGWGIEREGSWVEATLNNRVWPLSVTHRVKDATPLSSYGWRMLLPFVVFAEYTLVGIIPTSCACWEYRSSFGQ